MGPAEGQNMIGIITKNLCLFCATDVVADSVAEFKYSEFSPDIAKRIEFFIQSILPKLSRWVACDESVIDFILGKTDRVVCYMPIETKLNWMGIETATRAAESVLAGRQDFYITRFVNFLNSYFNVYRISGFEEDTWKIKFAGTSTVDNETKSGTIKLKSGNFECLLEIKVGKFEPTKNNLFYSKNEFISSNLSKDKIISYLKEKLTGEKIMTTPAPQVKDKNDSNMNGPSPMNFTHMIKADLGKAGYRVAATQMTHGIQAGIAKMLEDDGMSSDKAQIAAEIFHHPLGEALIKLVLGYGGSFIPVPQLQGDPRFAKLVEEFRVSGQADGLNHLADKMLKYVVPAITAAVKSLPPLSNSEVADLQVRVESPKHSVETEVVTQSVSQEKAVATSV